MAGTRNAVVLAMLVITAVVPRTHAFGRHVAAYSGGSFAPFCQPAPSYWIPAVVSAPICTIPMRSGGLYSVPSAAPASPIQTMEPPVRPIETSPPPVLPKLKNADVRDLSTAPTVVAARSLSANAAASGIIPVPKELCRVGFWNLTGRDVTLVVEGRTHALAKDRAVTLDLSRRFTWRISTGTPHVEQVGDEQSTHEVVVR